MADLPQLEGFLPGYVAGISASPLQKLSTAPLRYSSAIWVGELEARPPSALPAFRGIRPVAAPFVVGWAEWRPFFPLPPT